MTKRAIIISSCVVLAIIGLVAIMFGLVFRVRSISVSVSDNFMYAGQTEAIIDLTGIEKGDSVFGFNRDKIKSKVERAYPYAKLKSINVIGFSKVRINMINREGFYYVNENDKYYIVDEDCKVLEVVTDSSIASNYINATEVFNVGQEVEAGDFLNNDYSKICTELYKALYTDAMLNIGEDKNADGVLDEKYLDRQDMLDIITQIKFNTLYDLDGEVSELEINTSSENYGVTIKIVAPNKKLDKKINMAFSALRVLIENDKKDGTNLAKTNVIYINVVDGKITNSYQVAQSE